jgi:HAD superfamily hydrolase (TIGR01509 family)
MSKPVGLVIFDCDGVLVDSEPLAIRTVVEVLRGQGWDVTEGEIERYVGRSNEYMLEDLAERHGRAIDFDWAERYFPVFEAVVATELQPVPGIVEALDRIEVPTCVASSGSHRRMRLTLGATGLYEQFEGRIFSGEEVERGKPAPDLFLFAASSMGVEPGRCVVVEDTAPGVEAARAAGMAALGYVGGLTRREQLEGPGTTVFSDMAELPDLIARAGEGP